MKRRRMRALIAILLLGCVGLLFLQYRAIPDGSTVESREELLQELPQGAGWSIAVEQTLDHYIISGISSADGKSGIAVFEPKGNGKYKLASRVWRDSDEIIITEAFLNNIWYNLVWYNGAQTSYAEMKYTLEGSETHVITHNSENMSIFCHPAPGKDYRFDVVYYDHEGNKYE